MIFHDRRTGEHQDFSDQTLLRHFNSQLQMSRNLDEEGSSARDLVNPKGSLGDSNRRTIMSLAKKPEHYDGYLVF